MITLWHLPGAYDAALKTEPVHVIQHMSFLAAALLAWWPVLSPLPAWPALTPPLQCLYLFLYSIPNGIVGAFITFAAPGVYHYYETAPRLWGISVATDQQLAGVLMWVLGGGIYLLWLTVIFFRWAGHQEEAERRPLPSAGAS
jgi:putative membrane protein